MSLSESESILFSKSSSLTMWTLYVFACDTNTLEQQLQLQQWVWRHLTSCSIARNDRHTSNGCLCRIKVVKGTAMSACDVLLTCSFRSSRMLTPHLWMSNGSRDSCARHRRLDYEHRIFVVDIISQYFTSFSRIGAIFSSHSRTRLCRSDNCACLCALSRKPSFKKYM